MLSPRDTDEVVFAPLSDRTPEPAAGEPANAWTMGSDPRSLTRHLKRFAQVRPARSWFELAVTLVPFLVLCGVILSGVARGNFLALALTVPAALLLLRLFLIQHDCGHGAFLALRTQNDWVGRCLGVLTFTPYDCWRRSHALHHAGTGNLDERGFGDVDTLTVREYQARSRLGKLGYRLYRHPLVLFGVGPAYLFLLRHRLPIGLMRAGAIYWVSAIATNAATALLLASLAYAFGLTAVVLTILPVLLIAASTGVWLFYIQHQFEETHWDETGSWSFHEAALRGSSHLELPPVMRWFTANIGVHHIHHLASRIPFYRLPEVLEAYPDLQDFNRFTAVQTFGMLRLALWDEDQRRLVPFREASKAASIG
jgi:omega-6 fatty acid desaturase (delta-12 desaturase)